MKWLLQIIFLVGVLALGYQYRYKLMNVALSFGFLRKFIVARTLKMPTSSIQMLQRLYQS